MLKMIKYKWNQLFCLHIFKYLHSSVKKRYNEGYTVSNIHSYTVRCRKCGKIKKNLKEDRYNFLIAVGKGRENEGICN